MENGADDDDELDEQLSMMIKSKRRVVEGQMSQNSLKKNVDVEDKVCFSPTSSFRELISQKQCGVQGSKGKSHGRKACLAS